MNLVISNLAVGEYVGQSGFSESYEKVYDSAHQFTTSEGVEIKRCRGVRKVYNISLDQVPLNVKNMLRSRSRYGYISCTVDNVTDMFIMDSFSAQVIIQNGMLDLWTVSFTLSAKTIMDPSADNNGFYSVTCEGREYTMESGEIYGDIQITNNAGGLPKSGICASQMTFSLDLSLYGGSVPGFSPSAPCTIGGFSAPTYYITGRRLDGFIYTITATDRTIFLDLPFDYTSCLWDAERSKDNTVPTSYVVQCIASQAGFSGFNDGDISEIIPRIPYADLATTCRSILTSLSEIACGMWYCGSGNSLQFFGFGSVGNAMYATRILKSECTDLQRGLVTGPINGVLMINDSTDSGDSERFESGNVLESFNKIKVVSKYATASTCGALFRRAKNAEYTAFTIQHCYCYSYIPIGMRIILDDNDFECFMATNVNIFLSPTGSYASISGDADSEIEWDFSGLLTQQVNQRIAENMKYHGVSLSKKEGLVCEGVGSKITMVDGRITFSFNGTESNSEDTSSGQPTAVAVFHENGMHEYINADLKADNSDVSTEDESPANFISTISTSKEGSTKSNAVKLVSAQASDSNSADDSVDKTNDTYTEESLISVETEPGKKVAVISIIRRSNANSDTEDKTTTDNTGGDKNGD